MVLTAADFVKPVVPPSTTKPSIGGFATITGGLGAGNSTTAPVSGGTTATTVPSDATSTTTDTEVSGTPHGEKGLATGIATAFIHFLGVALATSGIVGFILLAAHTLKSGGGGLVPLLAAAFMEILRQILHK